jgi:beta-glucosidase
VVSVVSGRPLVLTDQLASIDALVASWLPGNQGEGVADVLPGRAGVHGRR